MDDAAREITVFIEPTPRYCTRYVAGEGRHRLQASCPLAPAVGA